MTDANDVLMGGGGLPGWAFPTPGTRKVARVADRPTTRQERDYDPKNPGAPGEPKFFPSGDPIMSVLVTVQTDERDPEVDNDDGRRTFYIEGQRLKKAVRDAVLRAGAKGLEVGGTLDVTLTHYDIEGDRRSGRNWQIVYTAPAPGNDALMADSGAQAGAPVHAPQQAPNVAQRPPSVPQPTGSVPPGMDPQAFADFQRWQAAQQAAATTGPDRDPWAAPDQGPAY